jgi:hypothetical protein
MSSSATLERPLGARLDMLVGGESVRETSDRRSKEFCVLGMLLRQRLLVTLASPGATSSGERSQDTGVNIDWRCRRCLLL